MGSLATPMEFLHPTAIMTHVGKMIELFVGEAERADAVIFKRRCDKTHRAFLPGNGVFSVTSLSWTARINSVSNNSCPQ